MMEQEIYNEKRNNMNIDEMLEISDCPLFEGGALLEEECGCSYYVMCLECGCHTVNIDFRSVSMRQKERLCFGIPEK